MCKKRNEDGLGILARIFRVYTEGWRMTGTLFIRKRFCYRSWAFSNFVLLYFISQRLSRRSRPFDRFYLFRRFVGNRFSRRCGGKFQSLVLIIGKLWSLVWASIRRYLACWITRWFKSFDIWWSVYEEERFNRLIVTLKSLFDSLCMIFNLKPKNFVYSALIFF